MNLYIDENWNQFNLLNKDEYNVITSKENLVITQENDDNIYIRTQRNSWFSSKSNVINLIREHDLDMLHNLNAFGFNVPKYIYCNIQYNYFKHMDYNKKYLIKSFESARSLGQCKIDKETIIPCIEDSCNLDSVKFNEKYNIDNTTAQNESEETIAFDNIKTGNYYISEWTDFNAEYRVLYFKGVSDDDIIIESRVGYQPNSKAKRTHKIVKLKDTTLTKKILIKIIKYCKFKNVTMMSFDIYEKDGVFGLFETNTEFGISYKNKYKELEQQMNHAIKLSINELKGTKQ